MKPRALIFGTGNAGQRTFHRLRKANTATVVRFADSNPKQQGRIIYGIRVVPPALIYQHQFDWIIIGSMHTESIQSLLVNDMGVPLEKVRYTIEYYGTWAQHKYTARDPKGAMACLRDAEQCYGAIGALYVAAGMAALQGDCASAIRAYKQFMALVPDDEAAAVWMRMAQTYRQAGQLKSAEDTVLTWLKQTPDHCGFNLELGEIHMTRLDWNTAIRHYEALRDAPSKTKPAKVYARLGMVYRRVWRFAEAENVLNQGLDVYPDHVLVRMEHAEWAMAVLDWPTAITRWQWIIDHGTIKARLKAVWRQARAYRYAGDGNAAEHILRRELETHPEVYELWNEYAAVAMERKDWTAAEQRWSEAHNQPAILLPPTAYFRFSVCLSANGKPGASMARPHLARLCPVEECDALIKTIQSQLPGRHPNSLISRYVGCKGGLLNYGFWEHRSVSDPGQVQYLTKIVPPHWLGNDVAATQWLHDHDAPLSQHTPMYADIRSSAGGDLVFVTMSYVDGHPATIKDLDRVLAVLALSPKLDMKALPPPKHFRSDNLRMDTLFGLSFLMSRQNKVHYRNVLLGLMTHANRRHNLHDILGPRWAAAQSSALSPGPSRYVMHGDLHKENILVRSDGHVRWIDWSHAFAGPWGYDLALVCSTFGLSVADVQKILQQLTALGASPTPDERRYFWFILAVMWLLFLDPLPMSRNYQAPDNIHDQLPMALDLALSKDEEGERARDGGISPACMVCSAW